MIKTYSIPVVYQVWGTISVEANSLQEARQTALEDSPLPSDAEYVDGTIAVDNDYVSFIIDRDIVEIMESGCYSTKSSEILTHTKNSVTLFELGLELVSPIPEGFLYHGLIIDSFSREWEARTRNISTNSFSYKKTGLFSL